MAQNEEELINEARREMEARIHKLAFTKDDKGFELEREIYYQETRQMLDKYLHKIMSLGWEAGYSRRRQIEQTP